LIARDDQSQILHNLEFLRSLAVSSLVSIEPVVRVREILDPELRTKIVAALAQRRGCSAAAIPDWFELDDADFVDLLQDLQAEESAADDEDDPRM
jgi:hypothetical protein